jgi:hypothetical protein
MEEVMSRRQVIAALKKAPKAYVWCNATAEDGCYFQVDKAEVLRRLKNDLVITNDDQAVICAFTDEETGSLYIN